jgi:hypothetical protein
MNLYRQDRATKEQAFFEGDDADKEILVIAETLEVDARDVRQFLEDGMTLPSRKYLWKSGK